MPAAKAPAPGADSVESCEVESCERATAAMKRDRDEKTPREAEASPCSRPIEQAGVSHPSDKVDLKGYGDLLLVIGAHPAKEREAS